MGASEDTILAILSRITAELHVLQAENTALARTLVTTIQRQQGATEAAATARLYQGLRLEEIERTVLRLGEQHPHESDALRKKLSEMGIEFPEA